MIVFLQGSLTAEEEQAMLAQYHYTGATTTIHPLLSSFVNYAQPVKFQGFDVAEGQLNISLSQSSYTVSYTVIIVTFPVTYSALHRFLIDIPMSFFCRIFTIQRLFFSWKHSMEIEDAVYSSKQ